jgi:hypothetical protein
VTLDVRDLTKSALTLPWAISMFGVQQMANLVGAPPSQQGLSGAAHAFDSVSDVAERQLDGWMKQTCKVGNGVQGAVVDLIMLRAPNVDSSTLMRMAAEMQSGPLFQMIVKYGMPPVGWLDSFLVPRRDSGAVQQEFANKLYIISLVTQVHGTLGLGKDSHDSLPAIIDRAAGMETFPRLWATEGTGNYWGDRAWDRTGGIDPSGLLNDASAASLPPWSLTMLHAGIGMSFAKKVLADLETTSTPEAVRAAVARFITLCRSSSRLGYTGAALESLGLATRTLYPNLVPVLDREIPSVDRRLQEYFWHGAGRAMYFDPMNMLPSVNAPWRAIRRLETEAPHPLAYANALAGLAWAIAVVNMRHPIVMESFLRHHADLARAHDAFSNGVTSSLMMRYDTTRDDARIAPFIHNRPADQDVAAAWRSLITAPCEQALRVTYGDLSQNGQLEALFRYRPPAQPAAGTGRPE